MLTLVDRVVGVTPRVIAGNKIIDTQPLIARLGCNTFIFWYSKEGSGLDDNQHSALIAVPNVPVYQMPRIPSHRLLDTSIGSELNPRQLTVTFCQAPNYPPC